MAEAAGTGAARSGVPPDWLAVGSKVHLLYNLKSGKNKGEGIWYNAEVLKHRGGPRGHSKGGFTKNKKGKAPPLEVLVNFDNGLDDEQEWFAEEDWATKLRDPAWKRKEQARKIEAWEEGKEARRKEKEEKEEEKRKEKEEKERQKREAREEKERKKRALLDPRENEVDHPPIARENTLNSNP